MQTIQEGVERLQRLFAGSGSHGQRIEHRIMQMRSYRAGGRLWSAGGSIFDMLNTDDRASWRAKASHSLEGIYATIAITVVTFFALFMDDFRLAILPTQLDVSCEYLSGLILVSLSTSHQARTASV